MKYNKKRFINAVKEYKRALKGKVKDKTVFAVIELKNRKAFYSIAPLSKAVHELEGDMHVNVYFEKENINLELMMEVWRVYKDAEEKVKTEKTNALLEFIKAVDKRTGKTAFNKIFNEPEIFLKAEKSSFSGTIGLEYKDGWHKDYRWKELVATAKRILKEGYNLRKNEKISIGFVLVPANKNLELPLEDYLDSYAISFAMAEAAKKMKAKPSLGSSTDRASMLAKSVRTAELITTLKGCELDKEVDEDVFRKYKKLSALLKLGRMEFTTAGFGVHAKGYYGRHFFGDEIGYPSLDKKTRWSSPGQLMLKDPFSPQTALEKREPMMRYALTETLPIDIFIETCNISYYKLKKRSEIIKNIFGKCEYIRVVGDPTNGYKTDLRVNLIGKGGKRHDFISSDCDVREIIDLDYFKKTGIKAGKYANFPSGEAFCTPESVRGIMVGDVVINIDRSYVIPGKSPLVINFKMGGYEVIKAPKKIKEKMVKERKEAMQKIKDYGKNKSLPKNIIKIYKKNFNSVGEFAVNTNPKAKLCDYLIVNEKIARMIHIALGSGFEPDRKSVYHWDIVVNSPKQKMNIYGVDKKGNKHWVVRRGDFAV